MMLCAGEVNAEKSTMNGKMRYRNEVEICTRIVIILL